MNAELPAGSLPDRLLDDRELAAILGVKASWVAESARQGQIPHVRLGRYRRFVLTDVLEWLEARKGGGGRSGSRVA